MLFLIGVGAGLWRDSILVGSCVNAEEKASEELVRVHRGKGRDSCERGGGGERSVERVEGPIFGEATCFNKLRRMC